jgi:hypothetical protein
VKPHEHVILEIARERERQLTAEGWSPEHDDEHANGELARAAAAYAIFSGLSASVREFLSNSEDSLKDAVFYRRYWPWGPDMVEANNAPARPRQSRSSDRRRDRALRPPRMSGAPAMTPLDPGERTQLLREMRDLEVSSAILGAVVVGGLVIAGTLLGYPPRPLAVAGLGCVLVYAAIVSLAYRNHGGRR